MVKKYLKALGLCASVCVISFACVNEGKASEKATVDGICEVDKDIYSGKPFQIVISPTKTIMSKEETISRILNGYSSNTKTSASFEIEISGHGKYTVSKDQCLFIDAENERVNVRGSIPSKIITYPGWRDSLLTIAHYAFHDKDATNTQASIEAFFNSEELLIGLVGKFSMDVPEKTKIYRGAASIDGTYNLRLFLKKVVEPTDSGETSSSVDKHNRPKSQNHKLGSSLLKALKFEDNK